MAELIPRITAAAMSELGKTVERCLGRRSEGSDYDVISREAATALLADLALDNGLDLRNLCMDGTGSAGEDWLGVDEPDTTQIAKASRVWAYIVSPHLVVCVAVYHAEPLAQVQARYVATDHLALPYCLVALITPDLDPGIIGYARKRAVRVIAVV